MQRIPPYRKLTFLLAVPLVLTSHMQWPNWHSFFQVMKIFILRLRRELCGIYMVRCRMGAAPSQPPLLCMASLSGAEREIHWNKFYYFLCHFTIYYSPTNRKRGNQAVEEWKSLPLFDFFNLTLPCGEQCPLSLAAAKSCSFHSDMKDIYMLFDVPCALNRPKLVEAGAFKLMINTENKTC